MKSASRLLWLLFAVNLFNYIDRQILFAVFPAIKADLHLSDTQLGLLASAFMWVYLSAAPVFGLLADRRSRPRLMGLGVGIWSAATAFSGIVRSYGELLFGRAVVGVGEASYGAVAPAMLSDAYEPAHRGRALALCSPWRFPWAAPSATCSAACSSESSAGGRPSSSWESPGYAWPGRWGACGTLPAGEPTPPRREQAGRRRPG